MARDIRDVWAYRDRMREKNDKRPGMFRGTNYVSGEQLNEEDKQRRLIELQEVKNKGNLAVTDRSQAGATKRQELANIGSMQRKQLEENRLLSSLALDREKFNQEKETTDEDFWFRKRKQDLDAAQFNKTENRLRDILDFQRDKAQEQSNLNLFEALNEVDPLTRENFFEQNKLNYLRTIMSPEAEAVFNQRLLETDLD